MHAAHRPPSDTDTTDSAGTATGDTQILAADDGTLIFPPRHWPGEEAGDGATGDDSVTGGGRPPRGGDGTADDTAGGDTVADGGLPPRGGSDTSEGTAGGGHPPRDGDDTASGDTVTAGGHPPKGGATDGDTVTGGGHPRPDASGEDAGDGDGDTVAGGGRPHGLPPGGLDDDSVLATTQAMDYFL